MLERSCAGNFATVLEKQNEESRGSYPVDEQVLGCKMSRIVCLDLEGVLIPEIWIGVAERTGIEALKLTTRDVADYDELMQHRLSVLDSNGIGLPEIVAVIDELEPLDGARDFLDVLRSKYQLVILSDTFYQFAGSLIEKLGQPALWCHSLEVSENGRIANYHLRQADPKRKAVKALQGLNFRVVAAGDSYNDISMLSAAQAGILFRAPESIASEFPQFPLVHAYSDLAAAIDAGHSQD